MLRELVYVVARPLSTVFKSLWELNEVPEDVKTSIFKKGKKGDPGKYSVVRLNMIPWMVMGQIVLEAMYFQIY